MTAIDESTHELPFCMRDNYAPLTEEVDATDLDVIGDIPPELSGRFFRNGANPQDRVPMHWFDGDGMLHGIRLDGGKAAPTPTDEETAVNWWRTLLRRLCSRSS